MKNAEDLKVLPILAPADIAATATASQYIDLAEAVDASFLVNFGAITNVSAAVTVEASSAASSNASESAIPFSYRLSSAVATDSMGAITAGTSDGVTVVTADDNKVLVIDLDPASLPAKGADYRYVRLVVTPSTANTVTIVGITALLTPRYAGNAIPSAT